MSTSPESLSVSPAETKVAKKLHVQIDRTPYKVELEQMTGAQIRQVPTTPIGPDRDLFQVVPGAADHKVGATEVVDIRNGLRFFTAPGQINPG